MQGTIKAIEEKDKGRYRLQIDKIWYSFFGPLKVHEGDFVNFEYNEQKGFKTILTIEKKQDNSDKMAFMVCLKCVSSPSKRPREIYDDAKELYEMIK